MVKANEIARRVLSTGFGLKEQDNLHTPSAYIQNSETSVVLGTPIADNVMYLVVDEHLSIRIESPIINVTRKKVVNTTNIMGLDSSIFEIVSNGDYNITVKFKFITELTWQRKRFDFLDFLNVANTKDSLIIINNFLNTHYNIDKVFLENYTTTPSKEYGNVIDVSLNLKFEEDYDIFDEYIDNQELL